MKHRLSRRGFFGGLAGMTFVGGTAGVMSFPSLREPALDRVSDFNDKVQDVLFDPTTLAQVYEPSDVTSPFPFNAFYPESYAPRIQGSDWRLSVDGLIEKQHDFSISELRAFPQETQVTRLICIEGWSAVGEWSGVPLSSVLNFVGADLSAKFVEFRCADDYRTSIDMKSAFHPQTILALDFLGRSLPVPYGAPCRLRIPTKLGFKNAKSITEIRVTNVYPGGYWEDQGYNWFAGL
ncbi:molybdopterin-dependent oxidoreductase [Litoreibacter roseus]|uniref:molybdopterin-dependent oxidoreductase n=1 Tax=Litoreibacter roseus TaxID=2601869 RepID=UPI00135ABE24|nr:molybdopterin-dependent oxidoreductase [Litoreibacter roseus]